MLKQILRAVIFLTQMILLCVWCFYIGTIFAVITLVIGFFIGFYGGGWHDFFIGLYWCAAHVMCLPFVGLYKLLYGADEWYKSETFFGI